ncbi:MAG: WD40 repeat domain-containing protein [Candidatus Bipolaricaulota bacterium]|nr:WD40 repeat domain-containing protein [Candidatus Bipolaricaulota bacterium]
MKMLSRTAAVVGLITLLALTLWSSGQETACPPLQAGAFCTFRGHQAMVLDVAFSSDSQLLVSSSGDGIVNIWSIPNSTLWRSLPQRSAAARAVDFRHDRKLLASAYSDGAVLVWDMITGQPVRTIEAATGLRDMIFTPDGKQLAVASCGEFYNVECLRGEITIWDPVTGANLHKLSAHDDMIESIAFSRDGSWLASGSRDDTIILWQRPTYKKIRTFVYNSLPPSPVIKGVSSVTFSPDSKLLAASAHDRAGNAVKIWEVSTGYLRLTLLGNDLNNSIAFSPDGRFLAAGSTDFIRIWEVATGKEVRLLPLSQLHRPQVVFSIAFSPDGRWLASAEG